MAQLSTFMCDECGTQKKESNHWFRLKVVPELPGHMEVSVWDPPPPPPHIKRADLKDMKEFHVCGETCLAKSISKHLK